MYPTARARAVSASIAGASAGLLALGLLAAAPAAAMASPAVINPGNVPATAEAYDKGEACYYLEGVDPETVDAWHFVAPGSGATIESLTASFDADGDLTTPEAVIVADATNSIQAPSDKHLYLLTEPGWTLIDATATIGSASVTLKSGAFFFVLSHACAGGDIVIPPQSVVSGMKYYDANRNGRHDSGEAGIAGWPIGYSGNTLTTDAAGEFLLQLNDGSYIFTEYQADSPWVQTGNTVDQTSVLGGSSVVLADKSYDVVLSNGNVSGLYFGNVCEIANTNGKTLGFWSNKNGQAILKSNPGWLAEMVALNLRNANGTHFDPTTYAQFRTWLLSATATNAAYMTSAQLAATKLNTLYMGLATADLIEVDGVWMSIADAISAADALLGVNGYVLDGNPVRAHMLALKSAFDDLNNNRATITPATAERCPAPTFGLG